MLKNTTDGYSWEPAPLPIDNWIVNHIISVQALLKPEDNDYFLVVFVQYSAKCPYDIAVSICAAVKKDQA